jgi:hypothetical protein
MREVCMRVIRYRTPHEELVELEYRIQKSLDTTQLYLAVRDKSSLLQPSEKKLLQREHVIRKRAKVVATAIRQFLSN